MRALLARRLGTTALCAALLAGAAAPAYASDAAPSAPSAPDRSRGAPAPDHDKDATEEVTPEAVQSTLEALVAAAVAGDSDAFAAQTSVLVEQATAHAASLGLDGAAQPPAAPDPATELTPLASLESLFNQGGAPSTLPFPLAPAPQG
ncbi:hypothetical protein ACFV0R_31290 [Streptomyces sp. NPDC059578]|uniref:hypothetical protein n=1 Tax=Streptomyces sp. NPDC059578 TaxID=3346874 RepID=UPI00368117BC